MLQEQTAVHIHTLSNDALIEFVHAGTDQYEQEAVDCALQEFKRRNLDPALVLKLALEAQTRVETHAVEEHERHTLMLARVGKFIALLIGCAGFVGLAFIVAYSLVLERRHDVQKIRDLWRFSLFGLVVHIFLVLGLYGFTWAFGVSITVCFAVAVAISYSNPPASGDSTLRAFPMFPVDAGTGSQVDSSLCAPEPSAPPD